MFGIWKRRKTDVLRYWYVVFDNFDTPVSEFYQAIEHDLEVRELTGLEVSRIEYAEGGMLSARREYLRMRRERLVFDICAAPFGTSWLFSCRFAFIPASFGIWDFVVTLVTFACLVWFYAALFGLILGSILLAASLMALVLLMRNAVVMGLTDLDASLIQVPVVGALYETFIRKETYYREDTRNAYCDIVEKVVKARIEELGAAVKKLVEYKEATPPSHPAVLSMVANMLRLAP